jgi:hypothetical protein
MSFGTTDNSAVNQARFNLSFNYVGGSESHSGTLFFNMETGIGDLEPTAAQEEAFQALVDMVASNPAFALTGAQRVWPAIQSVTPTE